MKRTGVTENKFKTIYIFANALNTLLVLISIINLIFNIVSENRYIFVGSIYLILIPYFKFLQSQSYIEIIPAAIIILITIFLLYKSSKEYCKLKEKRPYYTFLFLLWLIIASAISGVAFNIDNFYKFDGIAVNTVVLSIILILNVVAALMLLSDYYKNNPVKYYINPVTTNDIFMYCNVIPGVSSVILALLFTMKYCGEIIDMVLIIILYLMFAFLFIYFIVYYLYYYKKITKKFPKQKWAKKSTNKFVITQIISITVYLISFGVLKLL